MSFAPSAAAAAAPSPPSAAALIISALPPGSLVPAALQSTPAEQTDARALWSRPMASFSGPPFGNATQNQPADPAASVLFQFAAGSNGAAPASAIAAPPAASLFAAPAAGFFSAPAAAGAGLFSAPPTQSFGAAFSAPAVSPFAAAASGPSPLFSAPSASFFAAPAPAPTSLFAAPPPSSSFATAFGALPVDLAFKREKKRKDAAAAATAASSPASAPPPPCLMLSALSRDTGVQFYLTEYLSWRGMSALHRTCSAWRRWLDCGQLGSSMEISLTPDSYPSLERCTWVQRFIGSLTVQPQWLGWAPQLMDLVRGCLTHVLASVHRLPRLRELSLEINAGIEPSADEIRACFKSLATRLESLTLILPESMDRGEMAEQRIPPQLLLALPCLSQLRSFSLLCKIARIDSIDLSPLTLCPLLSSFTFNPRVADHWHRQRGAQSPRPFQCCASHLRTVVQCAQLTHLDMGEWTGQLDGEASLSILARTKASHSQSAAYAAASGQPAPADCVPLRFLDLSRGTTIDSARLALLSEFTSLEDLSPITWSSDLSAQDWLRLTRFTALQSITIHADLPPAEESAEAVPVIQSAEAQQMSTEVRAEAAAVVLRFLPALLLCSSLQTVRLGFGLELRAAQLTALVQSLPLLACLELCFMSVESSAPLAAAPLLRSLSIDQCCGLRGAHVNWRVDLPALPSLESLLLHDSEERLLTPSQAKNWNAALRARMPRLSEFKQNLRKPMRAEVKKPRGHEH